MLGMGKDDWIKIQLNRSYTNPYPEKEIETYLRPASPSKVVPWATAAKNVAEDIYANYKNLYVAMSGGIDSEFVAQTFYNLKIPFTPIIFKVSDLNELDIWWAFKWCKEHNIEPVVISEQVGNWVNRFISISKNYCTRFGQGTGTMSFISDYVLSQGGNLVSGGGFIEYFPDENISYMETNYKDSSLHNNDGSPKSGYILHEPDIIQKLSYPTMPFNFLSWTPEIVLSYVYHRDMSVDSATNKSRIMNCLPRPKNIGVPGCFFRFHPIAKKWVGIRNSIGTTECGYLGTKDEVISILMNGVKNEH
jgi:hypothetical protein